MTLYWKESMSTGVSEIDSQHQALIQQINRLEEVIQIDPDSIRQEHILDMFDYLTDYARSHFDDEERQMETFECEVAEENKQAHRQFLDMTEQLREDYQNGVPAIDLAKDIQKKLGEWYVDHICTVDCKLSNAVYHSGVWAT